MQGNFIVDPAQLLTLTGNALFVMGVVELLIKPILKRKYGLDVPGDPPPTPVVQATYSLWMNISAFAVGIVSAVIAWILLNGFAGVGLLTAVLIGFGGGGMAIGVHQLASHAREVVTEGSK